MISIITPIYNPTKEFFYRSWTSLFNQTSRDFEWILVYDGGDYPTFLSTEMGDLKVKEINLLNNYGPSVARNIGFQVADGDIISYLDIGDAYSPDRVKHIKETFTNTVDVLDGELKVLLDSYHIMQNGEDRFYDISLIARQYNLVRILEYQNISIPLSLSHTRDIFSNTGGFQRGIVCGEDGILIRRMVNNVDDYSQVAVSSFDGGTYYVSETGQSRTQRRFEMGGFAFDAKNEYGSHGQYLDKSWNKDYSSVEWFDK